MDWEIGNYAFGAAAGHPFLDAIIKNCVRAQQHPEWAEAMMKSIPRMFRDEYFVLATTGPGLVSRTLAEYPGACDQVKVLFPEDVCDPQQLVLLRGLWRSSSSRHVAQARGSGASGPAQTLAVDDAKSTVEREPEARREKVTRIQEEDFDSRRRQFSHA